MMLLKKRTKNFGKVYWHSKCIITNQSPEETLERYIYIYIEEAFLTRNHLDLLYGLLIFNVSQEDSFIKKGDWLIQHLCREELVLHAEGDRAINIKDLLYTQLLMGKWVRIINFKDCSLSLITDFT